MMNVLQKIANLENGFGLLGSIEDLKKNLPQMDDNSILDKLDEASMLYVYFNEEERLEYYKDVVSTDERALRCKELDDAYFAELEAEAKKRQLI